MPPARVTPRATADVARRPPVIRRVLAGVGRRRRGRRCCVLLPPRAMPVTAGAGTARRSSAPSTSTPRTPTAPARRTRSPPPRRGPACRSSILTDHGDATRAPGHAALSRRRAGDRRGGSEHGGRARHRPGSAARALSAARRAGRRARGSGPARRDVDRGASDLAQGRPPRGTTTRRPFDGIEWLNGDSEWRDERPLSLARILLTYWFRAPESLALILDRPDARLQVVGSRHAARTRSSGLGGSDAHAKIGGDLDHGGPAAVHLPSYEQVFRTFSIGLPGVTLSKNAAADARAVAGRDSRRPCVHGNRRVCRAARGCRSPRRAAGVRGRRGRPRAGRPRARASSRGGRAGPDADADALSATAPPSATAIGHDDSNTRPTGGRACIRVEATLPVRRGGGPLAPWLVSNPIYVGPAHPARPPRRRPPVASRVVYANGASPLTLEHSARSVGAVGVVRRSAEGRSCTCATRSAAHAPTRRSSPLPRPAAANCRLHRRPLQRPRQPPDACLGPAARRSGAGE